MIFYIENIMILSLYIIDIFVPTLAVTQSH